MPERSRLRDGPRVRRAPRGHPGRPRRSPQAHAAAPALRVELPRRDAVGADVPRPRQRRAAHGRGARVPRDREGHDHAGGRRQSSRRTPCSRRCACPTAGRCRSTTPCASSTSYRTLVGRVPTFQVDVQGIWKQGWDFRVTYPGGTAKAGEGTTVKVPPFDLGVTPQFAQSTARRPTTTATARPSACRSTPPARYGGCPVRGFGWSELIINWYDKEGRDPWWTGGELAARARACGDATAAPPGGPQGDMTRTSAPSRRRTPRSRRARSTTRAPSVRVRREGPAAGVGRRRQARRLDGQDHPPGPAPSRSSSRASAATRCTPAGRSGPATRSRWSRRSRARAPSPATPGSASSAYRR